MPDNLNADYAAVIAFLDDYFRFVSRLLRRVVLNPAVFLRASRLLPGMVRDRDALTGRQAQGYTPFFHSVATEEDRDSPLLAAGLSEYPVHAISDLLLEKFPAVDFEKILRLHEERQKEIDATSTWKMLGAVFGFGALLFSQIPKEIVQSVVPDYPAFQRGTFWLTVGAVGYLAIVTAPLWIVQIRARSRAQRAHSILVYTAIRKRA